MECDIFISYRRQGGREIARTLLLALRSLGYDHIFFDYNSLRDGLFNVQILEAINVCKDFVLILTPGSMDRCVNEDDWVRREITEALEVGCNIIPVRVDEQEVAFPTDFPRKLNIIRNIQSSRILTSEFFDDSITKLTDRLVSIPKAVPASRQREDARFVLNVSSDETCEVFVDGEFCAKVKGGKSRKLTQLSPNTDYTLEFRSLAVKKDTITRFYRSPKINKEDSLSISFAEMRQNKRKEEAAERESLRKTREIRRVNKHNLDIAKKQYEAFDFSLYDGMLLVQNHGKFGYLDNKGFEIIACQYDDALHFSNGIACVKAGNKWQMIDVSGMSVFPIFSDTPSYYTDGVIIVSQDGKYGAVNIQGEPVIPFEYDYLSQPGGTLIVARKGGNHLMLLHPDGKVANPGPFKSIPTRPVPLGIRASDIMLSYQSTGGDGRDSFPDIFESCPNLPGVVVGRNGLYGYLDGEGRQVVPCIAEVMYKPFDDSVENLCGVNLLVGQYKGKWGLFSGSSGSVVLPFHFGYLQEAGEYDFLKHSRLCHFKVAESVNSVLKEDDWKEVVLTNSMGAVDVTGRFIVPMEYSNIVDATDSSLWNSFFLKYINYLVYFVNSKDTIFMSIRFLDKYFDQEKYHEALKSLLKWDLYLLFGFNKKEMKGLHFVTDFIRVRVDAKNLQSIKVLSIEWKDGEAISEEPCREVLYEEGESV